VAYRVSFFWQQSVSKTGGWSENFWSNLGSIPAVKTAADALLAATFAYKANPCFCPRYRISQVGKFRVSQTILTQQLPLGTYLTNGADYPTTKVQLKLTAAASFTNQWFGGLEDSDVRRGGFWDPVGTSVGPLNAIKAILANPVNGWSIYGLDPAVLPQLVQSFNTTTGIMVLAPGVILDQSIIRVKNVTSPKRVNRIWRAIKTADNTFQLLGWIAGTEVFNGIKASARLQQYAAQGIVAVDYVQSTKHNVGRPTGLLGGRRRRRAS
jgi:hypothetical protein